MPSLPLVLSADQREVGRFPNLALVNLYAEDAPSNQSGGVCLVPTPGQTLVATLPFGRIRGVFQQQGTLDGDILVVSGDVLSRFDSDGNRTDLGFITGDLDCTFASDGVTVRVCNGEGLYKTEGLTVQFDRSNVSSVIYSRGHWFASESTTQLLYYLLPGDTDWDALQVVSAEDLPDKLVCVALNGELIELLGETTREAWAFTGSSSPPIEPYGGLTTRECGCLSRLTAKPFNKGLAWIGGDFQVWFSQGGAAQPISSPGLTERIRLAHQADEDVKCWTHKLDAHEFYIIHLGAFGTWVLDALKSRWHTRNSLGFDYWRATMGADAPSGTYVADSEDQTLRRLDPAVRTDAETEVERRFTSYVEHKDRAPVPCPIVWVFCSAGDAPATGQGSAPVMMLDTSDDQGQTFSAEEWAEMPVLGDYAGEVEFRGLERITRPGRLFRFTVTDPVLVRINSVEIP